MIWDIGHPSRITFLTSAPTAEARISIRSSGRTAGYGFVRTAASDVEKYCVWAILQKFEDARIRGHPSDLEHRESEPPNARVREDLRTERNVITSTDGRGSGKER